jgi:hypothetical protein
MAVPSATYKTLSSSFIDSICFYLLLQSILIYIFTAVLALASISYLLPRSNPRIHKHQQTFRVPLHVAVAILNAIIFVFFDKTTQSTVSSPLWPEYFALEGFLAHLIWPMCYPIIAAMPLRVAVPVQLLVGSLYISNNKNMCRNALKMYPQTVQMYTMLQNSFSRVTMFLSFSATKSFSSSTVVGGKVAVGSVVIENEAMCSNILLFLEVTMVVVVLSYFLFISELSDRQIYCAVAGKRELQGELRRRRPYAWQIVGEAALAWIVLWNIVMLVSNEWNFRLWNV